MFALAVILDYCFENLLYNKTLSLSLKIIKLISTALL